MKQGPARDALDALHVGDGRARDRRARRLRRRRLAPHLPAGGGAGTGPVEGRANLCEFDSVGQLRQLGKLEQFKPRAPASASPCPRCASTRSSARRSRGRRSSRSRTACPSLPHAMDAGRTSSSRVAARPAGLLLPPARGSYNRLPSLSSSASSFEAAVAQQLGDDKRALPDQSKTGDEERHCRQEARGDCADHIWLVHLARRGRRGAARGGPPPPGAVRRRGGWWLR